MSTKCKPLLCSGCAASTVCIRDPQLRRCTDQVHHYENGVAWTVSDVRAAINTTLSPSGAEEEVAAAVEQIGRDANEPGALGTYARALLAVLGATK